MEIVMSVVLIGAFCAVLAFFVLQSLAVLKKVVNDLQKSRGKKPATKAKKYDWAKEFGLPVYVRTRGINTVKDDNIKWSRNAAFAKEAKSEGMAGHAIVDEVENVELEVTRNPLNQGMESQKYVNQDPHSVQAHNKFKAQGSFSPKADIIQPEPPGETSDSPIPRPPAQSIVPAPPETPRSDVGIELLDQQGSSTSPPLSPSNDPPEKKTMDFMPLDNGHVSLAPETAELNAPAPKLKSAGAALIASLPPRKRKEDL